MVTADTLYEEDLQYDITYRQVRRVERDDAPPPGRFETTGRIKFARVSRYRRGSKAGVKGIQRRGTRSPLSTPFGIECQSSSARL